MNREEFLQRLNEMFAYAYVDGQPICVECCPLAPKDPDTKANELATLLSLNEIDPFSMFIEGHEGKLIPVLGHKLKERGYYWLYICRRANQVIESALKAFDAKHCKSE